MDRFEVTAFGNYTGDGELTTTRMDYKIQNAAGASVSGGGKLTPLCDAPGEYVLVKS
jgi:hypothetical protein